MTESRKLYSSVAALRNVLALAELIERVQARAPGLPGMACFYGPSGYGKTTASLWCTNRFRAYQVQVKSVWTRKKLCEAILLDVGIKPARTIPDMVDQIADEIGRSGRPLLIDEADHLISRGMIEIVRDIYESSEAPVILIGEEHLPQKLGQWERVHGRMLDWIGAEPGDMDDLDELAAIYCKGVTLSADLKERLLRESAGSIRRISTNLARVQEFAKIHRLTTLTAPTYSGTFFTGVAPMPRKLVA